MNEKEKAALGSIAASAGLTAAKAVVGLLTGSLAILSEAGHSLIDLSATVLTYFAVRISGKPADAEHQYGHGKVESVTALAETALLFLLTAIVVFEAVQRLIGTHAHAVEATVAAFAIIIGSIVIDFFRARVLKRVAQATASEALEADALHFRSDMWSSIAVLIGLFGVALGHDWADAAAALVVAVFICIAGYRLGRRTIDTLTDTAPTGVSEHVAALARQVAGVVAVERVRVRPAGAVLFVELAVSISRTLPLDRVTMIKQQLTRAIRGDLPAAELTITTEPKALDDETVRERVMVIARDLGLAIHHVAVQTQSGASSDRTSRSRRISSRCPPTCCPAAMRSRHASPKFVSSSPRLRRSSQRSAKCMRCGCGKPPPVKSSIFTATSIRRFPSVPCTTSWTRLSAGYAASSPQFNA
jgi:cation diffusion facilitator family transporter